MANSPRALVEEREEKEEEEEKVTGNVKPRVAEEEGGVMEEVMEGVEGETVASWVSCAASVAYARDVECSAGTARRAEGDRVYNMWT